MKKVLMLAAVALALSALVGGVSAGAETRQAAEVLLRVCLDGAGGAPEIRAQAADLLCAVAPELELSGDFREAGFAVENFAYRPMRCGSITVGGVRAIRGFPARTPSCAGQAVLPGPAVSFGKAGGCVRAFCPAAPRFLPAECRLSTLARQPPAAGL